MVGDIADESDQHAFDKNRHCIVDVRQMRAARRMRIVRDKQIALLDRVAVFIQQAAHQTAHRRNMDR